MKEYNESQLFEWADNKNNKQEIVEKLCNNARPASQNLGIFMAGSPGAGKTESAQNILKDLQELARSNPNIQSARLVHLEQDKIKAMIPGYTGSKAPLYQKPASRILASAYKYVVKNNLSFIHDTTFSNENIAKRNIETALKNKYLIQIYFVYQSPESAWRLVQERQKKEGRVVPPESFIQQFLDAPRVASIVKSHFGKMVELNIIIKNIDKQTNKTLEKIIFNANNIDSHIKNQYTKDNLTLITKHQ